MSFRLIPTRSFIRVCTSLSRPAPAFKNIYRMQYQYVRPSCQNLCYTQSRGIFWGDKKAGQEQAANAGAAESQTNTQTQENVNEAQNKEKAAEKETKTEKAETTQKKQTTAEKETKTTHNQESKPKQEVPEKFETLLENFTPENKKKLLNLWTKLEKEASDRAKQINELKNSVTNLEAATNNHKQKAEDLRNRLKEEIEEKEFMRKRFEKENEQTKAYAITKFAKDLIEVPDNLGRALDAAKNLEGKGDNLYDGVKATNNILLKTLARHGISQISPVGEKFDPNYHEALFDFDDPNQKPGTCGYVANVGYTIGDRVLRPAKVGVVKGVYQEEAKEEKKE